MKDATPKQTVSTWPAAALVVSNMVGQGIFMALGFQVAGFHAGTSASLIGGVFPIILLWIVGGVLALCGALCYAELATALPRSGGEYNFLSRIYHPAVGFGTGFCSATVGFAAPIAASALVFGDYFCRVFPQAQALAPHSAAHILAFILVTTVAACHLRSLRFTGKFQAATTGATILLLAAFVIFGFAHAPAQPVSFAPHASDFSWSMMQIFWGSLIWVMYSYSGWNAAAYIVEEVRNPARSLPRALILGTLFVMVLYVAVNAVFLYVTPLSELAGQPEVAHLAGQHIFGPMGARIGSALICVGLVANVSGMMWIGSRVTQAIGATYPKLGLLGRSNRFNIPHISLGYQYAIIFTLLFFDPNKIVNCVGTILIFWSLLAVVGVFVLRWREPNLPRPYRTWGYPVTPLIFAVISVFCLVQSYQQHRVETWVGAMTVSLSIPIYFWVSRGMRPAAEHPGNASLPEGSA